jgi:predicted secreted hydrolase
MTSAVVLAGLVGVGLRPWATAPGETRIEAGLSLQEALGAGGTTGYARADTVRAFDFPSDHGPHPDFRSEWWYLTGNLETPGGRRFGFQATFFRSALAPPGEAAEPDPTSGVSRWRSRQAWMAHFAVTDAAERHFYAFERFEREALGLAGARSGPGLRVWTGSWELAGRDSVFPLSVRLGADSVAVALVLEPTRGVVLQGDRGWSRKGPEPGNASYYYSMPRLATEGTVRTPAGTFDVRGESWLDREWSTSVLPEGVVGWDWFALSLDDGRDVMVYHLRWTDGTPSPFSRGTVVSGDPDGDLRVEPLTAEDYALEVLDRWESPVDGARYPVRWRLRVPSHGLDLEIRPVMRGQELDLAFRYWEGAVDVAAYPPAEERADPVAGRGYVELTGYAGSRPER